VSPQQALSAFFGILATVFFVQQQRHNRSHTKTRLSGDYREGSHHSIWNTVGGKNPPASAPTYIPCRPLRKSRMSWRPASRPHPAPRGRLSKEKSIDVLIDALRRRPGVPRRGAVSVGCRLPADTSHSWAMGYISGVGFGFGSGGWGFPRAAQQRPVTRYSCHLTLPQPHPQRRIPGFFLGQSS